MFKLTPIKNCEEVLGRCYKRTKNQEILEAFIASGEKCCLYEGWTNADAGAAATSLTQSANRYKLNNTVLVISRKDNVYLIRKDV